MTSDDEASFADLMTAAMAFWRQPMTEFTLTVWWEACRQFDLADVRRALSQHTMDPERGRFAPLPADIVRQLHGTAGDRSQVAWGKVMEAIRLVGAYRSVVFDEPQIMAAIEDMGGWPAVCRSKVEELPFLQRRFGDAYRAYAAKPNHQYPAVLLGEHDAANRLEGRDAAPPMLIGQPERARLVLKSGATRGRVAITSAADAAAPALEGVR